MLSPDSCSERLWKCGPSRKVRIRIPVMFIGSKRALFLTQAWLSGLAGFSAFGVTNIIGFNRDVRPILSENCYACHGPDKNQRKAKLRLDVREVAIEREAFVPGKPEQSKLVEHIFSTDPDEIMPPTKTGKKLTEREIALFRTGLEARFG